MDQARRSVEPEVMLDTSQDQAHHAVPGGLGRHAAQDRRGELARDLRTGRGHLRCRRQGRRHLHRRIRKDRTRPRGDPPRPAEADEAGDVFGWAALLLETERLAPPRRIEPAEVVRINGDELLRLLESDPDAGDVVMSRFATMIRQDYTVPDLIAQLRTIHRKLHAGDVRE